MCGHRSTVFARRSRVLKAAGERAHIGIFQSGCQPSPRLFMSEKCASPVMVVLLNGVRMPPGSQPISTSSYVLKNDGEMR